MDSVLAQTYTNWECIIVDDHSTDNSWEILEEYAAKDSRFQLYKRPNNRKPGGNASRNYAFELSKGKFINWFDSDDLMVNDKIEKQVEVLLNSKYDFVITNIQNFEDKLVKYDFKFETDLWKRPIKYLKGSFWFGSPIPLFKRSFLNNLKFRFNDDLRRNQEGEFFTKILLETPNIYYINKIKVIRINNQNSISFNYLNLSLQEKIKLDYPSMISLFNSFKAKSFLGYEEKEFFTDWFITFIQYSGFNGFELFSVFSKAMLCGDFNQRKLAFKSYLYKLIWGGR